MHLFDGQMFHCVGYFNTIINILFLFDSSHILYQLKTSYNENKEKLDTEDVRVSIKVTELVESFK